MIYTPISNGLLPWFLLKVISLITWGQTLWKRLCQDNLTEAYLFEKCDYWFTEQYDYQIGFNI